MEKSTKKVIKKTTALTNQELIEVKKALFREFKVDFQVDDQTKNRIFFLFKQEAKLLAMGAIWRIYPVIFNKKNYEIYGIVNVVSNIKNEGYGKKVLTEMKKYLSEKDQTILGFCSPKNAGFYEKCGFKIEKNSTQRFIYQKDKEEITNQDGQIIFYQDSSTHFMENILKNPKQKVSLPTNDLW